MSGQYPEPGRLPGDRGADAGAAGRDRRGRRQRQHDHQGRRQPFPRRPVRHVHQQRPAEPTTSATSSEARGLTAPSATDVFYDLNAGVGGPIARDRLWFYGSGRRFRVDRFEASTFNPDGIAGPRREPDLERDRQAHVADQPGQPALGLRRLQLQGPRPSPPDDGGVPVRVAGGELLLAARGARSPTSS